jgi:hypothetical protein
MHRAELTAILAERGLAGVQPWLGAFTDGRQRIQLWRLAADIASHDLRPFLPARGQAKSEPPGGWWPLDQLAAVYRAGIDEALAGMAHATDSGDADWFKQAANVLSYNLAADLAPCWPGDSEPRKRAHYELGVSTMRRAIRWRIELSKPAENMTLAYWALGIHLLGLGELPDGAAAFDKALEYARLAAGEYGRRAEVSADGDWQVVLNSGFRGLARALNGDSDGQQALGAALLAFQAMGEAHPDLAADAKLGHDQLEQAARLFQASPAGSPSRAEG